MFPRGAAPYDKPLLMLRSVLTLLFAGIMPVVVPVLGFTPSAKAQQAPLFSDAVYTGVRTDALWQDASLPNSIPAEDRIVQPLAARYVSIDWSIMDEVVAVTKAIADDERKVITRMFMPMPGGTDLTFEIWEDPIMHPDLAEKFPEIKTYAGISQRDPSVSIRLDVTPQGLHAQILRPEGTIYMDPVALGETNLYQVYHRRDYRPHADKVRNEIAVLGSQPPAHSAQRASGDELRTYRMALACTGEYALFHGGTVSAAMGAMATTMNRVNGIYERDFSVRMELIPNNDLLIFLDGSTDPYTNFSGATMLSENQSTINSIIGSANYDVGHVFSTGGGGIASLGSVCDNGDKARGVTGLPSPVGDPFDVDYVSHELGHQFRGEHSWNYCGGPFGSGSTDFEPGSGSTIMGYAGLCGSDDYVSSSDDYFHGGNVDQMIAFITTGGGSTCGTVTSTGNDAPDIVDYSNGFTIPISTPFMLTAEATDPQNDPLTYCWEQVDGSNNIGLTASPDGVFGVPLFRTFLPTTDPVRFFPSLDLVVEGNTSRVEYLPSDSRDLDFQITVRDNRPGGGGVSFDFANLVADEDAGPFVVTEPTGSGVEWRVGYWYPVSWDVAGTDVAPFDCATVRIEMSTDGGYTYPFVLAESVPNNGGYVVKVPDAVSSAVRVRVACNENVFYNINDEDLSVINDGTVSGLEAAQTGTIGLFPNPAQNHVRVQWSGLRLLGANPQVQVIDATGRVVLQQAVAHSGDQVELNLEPLAAGLYSVVLLDEEGALGSRRLLRQ